MLLASNINFNITPAAGESSAVFAIATLCPGKNHIGALALQNIAFTQSVDFVERMVENQGDQGQQPVVVEYLLLFT